MSKTYHFIEGDSNYLHLDVTVEKNYNLYDAIFSSYDYLVNSGGTVFDPEYSDLSNALESAMVAEVDLIETSEQLENTILYLTSLVDVLDIDSRYLNLKRLFTYLRDLNTFNVASDRITTLSSTSPKIEYSKGLMDSKGLENTFTSKDTNIPHVVSVLEQLNLEANELVPFSLIPEYVRGLEDSEPIEKVLKNNLFNYSTFSNSELRAYTLVDNPTELKDLSLTLLSVVYASEYFNKTASGYSTFNNYIDFDVLADTVNRILSGFKSYIDYLDYSNIDVQKYSNSYYPSGQEELFTVLTEMRQVAVNIDISYNFAKMFYEQRLTQSDLQHLSDVISELEGNQLSESNLVGALTTEFGISETEALEILYNGTGDSKQKEYLSQWITISNNYYQESSIESEKLPIIFDNFQSTSASYNSYVSNSDFTKLDLNAIQSSLIDSMSTIKDLLTGAKDILKSMSDGMIVSFELTFNLKIGIDPAILDTIASNVQKFNSIMYNANCILNALSCFASYVNSVTETLSSFLDSEAPFDPRDYLTANLSLASDGRVIEKGIDVLAGSKQDILDRLTTFTSDQVEQVKNCFDSALGNLQGGCITGALSDMYNEAIDSAMESIEAVDTCKLKPVSKLKVSSSLEINTGLDLGINLADLRFKSGNCTGGLNG